MTGMVLQNRITRRYRRVVGQAAGTIILREVRKDGYLGNETLFLPSLLVLLLYRERPDLVAPFFGKLHKEEW